MNDIHDANKKLWDATAEGWARGADSRGLWRRCPDQPQLVSCEAVLELLEHEGSLVRIAQDLWMDSAALAQAKERIATEIATSGGVSIAQIRDLLQTSRRYAVPLCEYLDRTRFTRRQGDLRVLAGEGAGAGERRAEE